jgi:putative inorganic carbon (HCO3(-)) transporter
MQLLAAWLDPEANWPSYLAHPEAVPPPIQLLIQENLPQSPLRTWLTSVSTSPPRSHRLGVNFAYRNYQAQAIHLMLEPLNLKVYNLIDELGLFQPWPRECWPLDHHIEALRTTALGLPHPTRNQFRLTSLELNG